jgi:hypothetical protein
MDACGHTEEEEEMEDEDHDVCYTSSVPEVRHDYRMIQFAIQNPKHLRVSSGVTTIYLRSSGVQRGTAKHWHIAQSEQEFALLPEPATEPRWPMLLRDVGVAVADRATPAPNRRTLPWQNPHAIGLSVHPPRGISALLLLLQDGKV